MRKHEINIFKNEKERRQVWQADWRTRGRELVLQIPGMLAAPYKSCQGHSAQCLCEFTFLDLRTSQFRDFDATRNQNQQPQWRRVRPAGAVERHSRCEKFLLIFRKQHKNISMTSSPQGPSDCDIELENPRNRQHRDSRDWHHKPARDDTAVEQD